MADWKTLYPFQSRYLEIPKSEASADVVRMHYVSSGQAPSSNAANGEASAADSPQSNESPQGNAENHTVLCVHGNPTWSFTYREILKQVSDQARVIAVDHIGCGLSDKPQQYDYCLERHIGNLARLIEKLDLHNVTLVVHDWGGAIGFGAALRHPTRIKRFCVLNTAAFPPPYVPWRISACRIPWFGNFAMRGLNLFAKSALTMTLNRLPRLEPTVASGLIAPYGNWRDRIGVARFVQDIPTRKRQATWQDLSRIEQNMNLFSDHPTQIVWGEKDWCFRMECLERLTKLLPHASVTQLADVGHYVMEEAPEEVIAAIRKLLATPA